MLVGSVQGRIGAINAMYNSAFNWMSSANSLITMTGNAGNMSPADLLASEKSLRMGMLNDSLTYKASELQEEVYRKLIHDDIKRTFSTFA